MKLSCLYENFDRESLFDLYALNLHDRDNPYYKFLLRNLYADYMRQFKRMLDNRNEPDYFTSVGGVWLKHLPKKYDEIRKMPKMMAIDQINALTHHGGYISDYFDERKWLESALDKIFAADSVAEYWDELSMNARKALWPHLSGKRKNAGIPLAKQLYVKLARKASKFDIDNLRVVGNKLIGTRRWPYYYKGFEDAGRSKPLKFVVDCDKETIIGKRPALFGGEVGEVENMGHRRSKNDSIVQHAWRTLTGGSYEPMKAQAARIQASKKAKAAELAA